MCRVAGFVAPQLDEANRMVKILDRTVNVAKKKKKIQGNPISRANKLPVSPNKRGRVTDIKICVKAVYCLVAVVYSDFCEPAWPSCQLQYSPLCWLSRYTKRGNTLRGKWQLAEFHSKLEITYRSSSLETLLLVRKWRHHETSRAIFFSSVDWFLLMSRSQLWCLRQSSVRVWLP